MNAQNEIGDFPRRAADQAARLRPVETGAEATSENDPRAGALRAAVALARAIAEEHPEPFRSLAFTAVLDRLLREPRPAAPAPAIGEAAAARQPDTSMQIAEFLASLRHVDSHPSRVVAIAYYHEKRQPGYGITTRDLIDAYQRARIKRPQNFPDVIASCMRRGYLVEAGRRDGMKVWQITSTGERLIEQTG